MKLLNHDLQNLIPESRSAMLAYHDATLPTPKDGSLTNLLEDYRHLTADQRHTFATGLTGYQPGWFDTYSLRMCMISVRQQKPDLLAHAFVALSISAATAKDEREVLMSLPPLYRSLALLGEDMQLVQTALEAAPSDRERRLIQRDYLLQDSLTPLTSGGYREMDGAHGVLFIFGKKSPPADWL